MKPMKNTQQIRPVRPFGDGALVAELTSVRDAHALAAAANDQGWDGVEDVVVGYRSVVVIVDPSGRRSRRYRG